MNPPREELIPSDGGAFQQQPDDDAALVARAQAGESTALALLFDRYRKFVYRFCRALLRNQQDAEDATQETWRRVYENLSSAPSASFRFWLTRITKNLIIDQYRHQKRRPEDVLVNAEMICDPDPQPEEWVLQNEARAEAQAQVLPLLALLNEGERLALVLPHITDLTDEEIAQILGKPSADAVAQQRYRGLKKIRNWLRQKK